MTERGRGAAAAVRSAVPSADTERAGMISRQKLAGLRAGLIALITIRERLEDESGSGGTCRAAAASCLSPDRNLPHPRWAGAGERRSGCGEN